MPAAPPSAGAPPTRDSSEAEAPPTRDPSATAAAPARDARWVELAEVMRPHGVRGEVRVRPHNADSDLLPTLTEVVLRATDGVERKVAVTGARRANDAWLLKFAGVTDRDGADALRGAQLCVPREALPSLDGGEFYVVDIVGARVFDAEGVEVGTVDGITSYPSIEVLVVRRSATAGDTLELPLLDEFVARVDASAGEVHLAPDAVSRLT